MLLATYQPLNPIADGSAAWKADLDRDIERRLGFSPIWAFPARSVYEFILHSIPAAPNYPEKLYVFESDAATPIDVVQWNNVLYSHERGLYGGPADLEPCFHPLAERYCEYVVPDIPEPFYTVDLKELIFDTSISINPDTGMDVNAWNSMLRGLQNQAVDFIRKFTIHDKDNRQQIEKRVLKMAYEQFLAPFIHAQYVDTSFREMFAFRQKTYAGCIPFLSTLLAAQYNGEQLATYERQDHILRLISSCFTPLLPGEEIGRNDLCPCGSGKKFKKCCLTKYEI